MHTEAYNGIKEKLNSTGREYMDGYSSQDFTGLTDAERAEIADVLKLRAVRGDGVSLDALPHALGQKEFAAFIENLLSKPPVDDLAYAQILTAAMRYVPEHDLLRRLAELLKSGDVAARTWILNKLDISDFAEGWIDEYSKILGRLLFDERDRVLLISEIDFLLRIKKLMPKSAEFLIFAKRLQVPDKRERKRALSDLGLEI